ncbi:MAG: zinc ribbon domain-containing protein [Candidatus Xenobiia bacterium LiM19]
MRVKTPIFQKIQNMGAFWGIWGYSGRRPSPIRPTRSNFRIFLLMGKDAESVKDSLYVRKNLFQKTSKRVAGVSQFCTRCGKQNNDAAKFCSRCGGNWNLQELQSLVPL